jgi:hypothetical protein
MISGELHGLGPVLPTQATAEVAAEQEALS